MNTASKLFTAAACFGIVATSASAVEVCFNDYSTSARELICYEHDHVSADLALFLPVGAVAAKYDGFGRTIMRSLHLDPTAGDSLDDFSLNVSGVYTDFDDSLLGISGNSRAMSLQLSANHGDNIVGFGVTYDALDIKNTGGIDTTTLDGFYGVNLNDNFTAGVLGSVSVVNPKGGASDEQYGIGAFLAGDVALNDTFTLGAVTAVSFLDGIGNSEWLSNSVVDLTAVVCEHADASIYVGYTDTLESSVLDGYFTIGAEVTWNVSDVTSVSFGYEQTVEHDSLDDDTYVLQVTHSF